MLTAGTFLLYEKKDGAYTFGSDSTTKWAILHPITEYPDLDAEIDAEDNTTLSYAQHTYEPALPDSGGSFDFNGYYNTADYETGKGREDYILHVGLSFGGTTQSDGLNVIPTGGTLMKDFNARVRIRITGAGVGDVRPIAISVYPTIEAATYPTA